MSAIIIISANADLSSTPSSTSPTAAPAQTASADFLNEWSGSYPTVVCALFMILCPFFVALRFWARRLHHATWGLDDLMIFPALFSVLISQAIDMALIHAGGIGRHVEYWEIHDPSVVTTWLKLAFGVEFLYLLCICLTKLSLLSIYLRVLVRKEERCITWILVGITLMAWLGQTIACCLQCIPFAYQWDKTIPGGYCFNQQYFYEYLSVSNLVTDVFMIVLPLPTVYALKVRTLQKWGLAIVFLSGSIGFIASIVRFVTYFRVDLLSDITFKSGQLIMWTIIEPGMYMISACLPAMRPLLQRFLVIIGVSSRSSVDQRRPTATTERSRESVCFPRGPRDPYAVEGDKTPLAVSHIELAKPARSNSDRVRPFGPNEATVTTSISSSGRAVVPEQNDLDGAYPSSATTLNTDGTSRRSSERERRLGPGQILVTTTTQQCVV